MIRFAIGYMAGFASAITFIVIWSVLSRLLSFGQRAWLAHPSRGVMSPETVLILCLLALTVTLGAISLFACWLDCADEDLERQDREDGKRW